MLLKVWCGLLLLLSFTPVGAQTFTQRIQQKGSDSEGKVTVTHNTTIDKLVNGKGTTLNPPEGGKKEAPLPSPQDGKNQSRLSSPARSEATSSPLPSRGGAGVEAVSSPLQGDGKTRISSHSPTTLANDSTPTTVDTRKKVMRKSYHVTGYRVQAYAGGNQRKDRQKAERIGNDIKMNYPDEPVYVHFYSPRWICRVGNYRTYEEAHQMLLNVRRLGYTSATIVKGKISIQY